MNNIPTAVHSAERSVSRPRKAGWEISAAYTAAGELLIPMATPDVECESNRDKILILFAFIMMNDCSRQGLYTKFHLTY